MATNYTNIETYRMEKNPETRMMETLDVLDHGATPQDVNECLMRCGWIDQELTIQERLYRRDAEKVEFSAWCASRK